MILLILVSLTCVSAADENQAVDIVTQDSEIIANESITNDEYDEDNDVLADPMGSTSFTELTSEIGMRVVTDIMNWTGISNLMQVRIPVMLME